MGEKLLPCPFCGMPPDVYADAAQQETKRMWFRIGCTKARSADCPAFAYTGANTRREAARRWNTRSDHFTALRDAAEAVVKMWIDDYDEQADMDHVVYELKSVLSELPGRENLAHPTEGSGG